MKLHYWIDLNGNPQSTVQVPDLSEYNVEWRLVANWPRNTWLQERRRIVAIREFEIEVL